jgi:hypothetical protein
LIGNVAWNSPQSSKLTSVHRISDLLPLFWDKTNFKG